jgi:hypothetical protein
MTAGELLGEFRQPLRATSHQDEVGRTSLDRSRAI